MADIPETFPTPAPSAIASYDYTDVASNTGMQQFFLLNSHDGANYDYHLTEAIIYSEISMVMGGTDEDYDLSPFNLPATIEGVALIDIPFRAWSNTGDMNFTITCTLRKVVGLVEEDIVAVTSSTKTIIADAAEASGVWCLRCVVPFTRFKKGDVLRLTVVSTIAGGGAGKWWRYGADPKSRASGTQSITDGNILIPFKLNL